MDFDDLKDPELQEKLKAAESFEQLVALTKAGGFEMSDAQLEAVAGGGWGECWNDQMCSLVCEGDCPCNNPYA